MKYSDIKDPPAPTLQEASRMGVLFDNAHVAIGDDQTPIFQNGHAKPTTLDLIDQASMLVQSSLVSGEPIPIEAMATWEGNTEDKLASLYHVFKRLGGEIDLLAAEADRLHERGIRLTKDQDRVKALAADLMVEYTKVTKRKKCKTSTLTFSVSETKAVHVFDEKRIPDDLWVTPPPRESHPSKKLIASAFKHGGPGGVPGAELVINHHMQWK